MAFTLTEAQHNKLDALLGTLLDAYKAGEHNKSEITGVIAHLIAAGALDNKDELVGWIERPDVLENWKDVANSHR